MRKSHFLSLFVTALLLEGCVTIPNTTDCTVAGLIQNGMICAETNTSKTSQLTAKQMVEFLEPQPERPDPNDATKTLPARAGATCQSSEDRKKIKDAIEEACRELGTHCTYEIKQAIEKMR